MSKKTRAPTRKKRPIADSLRTSFRTLLDRQIIDLGAVREGRANAERLLATRPRLDGELDPSHAVYIEMLNLLSVLCEQLTSLEELGRHAAVIIKAEDEYVPGWPPMSPISTSHFNTWSMLDLAIGVERETIASIVGFNYWNEYIFEAYWSHTDGMIGLLGLPDLPESRPQSREVEGDTGKIAKYYGMVPRDP